MKARITKSVRRYDGIQIEVHITAPPLAVLRTADHRYIQVLIKGAGNSLHEA